MLLWTVLLATFTYVLCFTKVLVPSVYREFVDSGLPDWLSNTTILQKYNYSTFLYQKLDKNAPNFIEFNRGTEGAIYLKYIVDHYDNFPDVAVFVHARPHDHQPKFLDYIGCISPTATYMSINWLYLDRTTLFWPELELWMEQCWRDVLKIVWDMEDKIDEFERKVPLTSPIKIHFSCCQQFVLSRDMVRKRPVEVWKRLFHIVNEQEVCHPGEPDYQHLYAFRHKFVKVGPETPNFKALGEDEQHPGHGAHIQGGTMEHLAHVIFGFQELMPPDPSMDEICSNFLPNCPSSPCDRK